MHKTRKGQRGAVAVEFALVMPVLLTLLGMMTAIGLGLKARHQMLTYASSAARYCAFQKPTANVKSSAAACVNSYVNYLVTQDKDNNMPPCTNTQVTSTVKASGVNPDLSYLVVEMSCLASWVPVVGPIAGVAWPGTTYQVIAKSSMPFLGPQTLAVGPP